MPSGSAVLCLLLLHTGAHGFGILPDESESHLEITERAILNVTVQVCRAVAQAEGTDFTSPVHPLTVQNVALACNSPQSSKTFLQAIQLITLMNVRVDIRHALNASYHFDDESFTEGRKIITAGLQVVKASNKQNNYEAARQKLGEITHPLQDFYSHSNWVELGKIFPNPNLIRSDTSIGNLTDENTATCRSCDGDDCTNNILEVIRNGQFLTSGYFSIVPLVSTKPKGKCSHGGAVDQTSKLDPKGGINKDTFSSSHGHLHTTAANMAAAATSDLLEDIRGAAGDKQFLQMLGISRGSSKALCFVVDTTNSMKDDMEAVRNVASSIINRDVGTENQPSLYILVPFNDPEFGPLIKTPDSLVFQTVLNSLQASGGGDDPELSLSGLQLALSGAPWSSEIFLFTDGPAKDANLRGEVMALIERTHTVVNFFITDSVVVNRRRRRRRQTRRLSASDVQLYRDLAQTSGGLAIEVTKTELPAAVNLITESTSPSLVTLLQAAWNPGKAHNFTFIVDETVTDLRVYITSSSITFTIISPTGGSQQSSDTSGSLISASQSVGNFHSLQLNKQAGTWEINMVSTNPYTLKVIGQSSIDFLFDFVQASQGPFGGFDALDTRPRAGVNGSLLVSLTGSNSATVTTVSLVESDSEIRGVVFPQGSGSFLVQVDRIPSVEFSVKVKGRDDSSSSIIFQRQSSTNFRGSNITITADSDSILEAGTLFSVPFSVMTSGTGGNFTIRATNSRVFHSTSPTSLILETGKRRNGTVTLSAPLNSPSGSDVTLTIEAEAPDRSDNNYIVLRISIVNTVTDFTAPVCERLSLQSDCSESCSLSWWSVSIQVSDGVDGMGVDRVTLKQGNGTMTTSLSPGNEKVTLVSYNSSCCSPEMQLQVVDGIGNVGSCSYSSRQGSSGAQSAAIRFTLSPVHCFIMVVFGLQLTAIGI